MSAPVTSTESSRTRTLAASGIAGAAIAVVLIGLMHAVATDMNPIQQTISQYALGPYDWMFDIGVIVLAVGSALIGAALVRGQVLRARSAAVVLWGAWVVGLVVVVAFERTRWSEGATLSGSMHRVASIVAFLAIPLAALATARWGRRTPGDARIAAWTRWLGIASLLWFVPILVGVALAPSAGVDWWDLIPLGLLERGLALTEVAAVVAMGIWAYRGVTDGRTAVTGQV